jgi:hypothetical protein
MFFMIAPLDVCSPMQTKFLDGASCIITFIDDFSRKIVVKPMLMSQHKRDKSWIQILKINVSS